MRSLVQKFPETLLEGLQIGLASTINKHTSPLRSVHISGLGGSAIGGNFIQDFVRESCPLPVVVSKGYSIPKWIDKNTLAIFSSYSGNTEETLSALEQAIPTGAKIVCIASGGKLIEIAQKHGFDFIQVPGGWPSPRACMGFSIAAQLAIFKKMRLIDGELLKNFKNSARSLKKNQKSIDKRGKQIAEFLNGKTPIIYTTDRMEAAAIRLRQQINENAKLLCWHHVLPEMNHNELVGWRTEDPNLAVIFLRNHDDLPRNQTRIDLSKEVIENFTGSLIEIFSNGDSLIEKALYFVHLGDFVSCHLADFRKMDPIEIKVIDFLKGELAKN
jgi:glucose/mannose-6-phosphate isomerase